MSEFTASRADGTAAIAVEARNPDGHIWETVWLNPAAAN